MKSRLRKFARGGVVAGPFLFFGLAIALFYGVPFLVDRGTFNDLLREKISDALGIPVAFKHAQIQNVHELVLGDVSLKTDGRIVEKLGISEVRVRFSGPVPLGEIELVNVSSLQADVHLDSDRIDELTRRAEERAQRTGSKKKRWQDQFEIDIPIPRDLKLPRIQIRDSVVQGQIGKENYRITGVHGSIATVGRTLPFDFRGSSGGQPDFFKLLGIVEHADGGSHLTLQEFKLGEMGITASLNTAGASSTLTFDLKTAVVTRELAQLIQIVAGGTEISGKLTGRSILTRKDGNLERFEFHAVAEGYSIKTGGTLAQSDQPSVIDLVVTPAPNSLDVTLSVERMQVRFTDRTLVLGKKFQLKGTLDDVDGRFHWAKGHFTIDQVKVAAGPLKGSEFSRCDVSFDVKRIGETEVYESDIDLTARDLYVEKDGKIQDYSSGVVHAVLHAREEPLKRLYQLTRSTIHVPEVGILQASGMFNDLWTGALYEFVVGGERLELSGLFKRLQDLGILNEDMRAEGKATGSMNFRKGTRVQDIAVDAKLDKVEFQHAGWKTRDLSGRFRLNHRTEGTKDTTSLQLTFDADRVWMGNLEMVKPKGDIPLQLYEGHEPADAPAPVGWLEAERIVLDELTSGPKKFTFTAKNNGLIINEGLSLAGLGGSLDLGPVTVKNIVQREFEMTSSLQARDLDLGKLFKLFKLEGGPVGKSFCSIDKITYTKEKLRMEGTVTALMLGGNIYIRNPEIQEPFTEFASYVCQFDFQHISLKHTWRQVVNQGVLRGTIKGQGYASIFNTGEPNEFWIQLELDADHPKKEDQYLDLQALKKVIVTLQGDEKAASDLDRSPYREFTYGKLGIYVKSNPGGKTSFRGRHYRDGGGELREYSWDQLKSGFAEPRVTEYLMVGTGMTPLNIINQTSLNQIMWSDFVARLTGGPKSDPPPDDDK